MTPAELFDRHVGFAKSVAKKYSRCIRCPALRDDLEGAALVGLWKASGRYREGRGVKFVTYAGWVVLGEVVDWFRRAARTRTAAHRDGVKFVSLSRLIGSKKLSDVLSAEEGPDEAELKDSVERALRALPTRSSAVLRMVYLEGFKQYEAAAAFGVSAPYVSQIVKSSLKELKEGGAGC